MAIKRSSQGGTPFGTTANRPANPAVGQTYYNGTLGYLEIYTASGWTAAAKAIPFGNTAARPANPVIGEPYFNGQEARLELYTSTGWQNIVQETPAVVSIVGQLNETTTSTLTINGTNFAAGATAFVVGTSGVETIANSTTLVSVVEITAVFPALAVADAPYDVKIVNPSNLYGVLYETLGVNDKPVWSTTAGSLGTFTELDVVSVTVAATDTTDSTNSPLQYSLVSGSLPGGLSLNSTTGVISGTLTNVISNTTYSFTIGASDSRNTTQTRAFSISVNDRSPIWTTSSVLPVFTRNVAYSTSVSATEDDSGAITYSLASGSLPSGLSLSSGGLISGTPTSATAASFTIRATVTSSGTTADRAFTMANTGPVWSTAGTISAIGNSSAYSFQLSATDDSGIAPTYSLVSGTLPSGISVSSSGLISGTASGITTSTGTLSITFRATDANGTYADQTLSIPTLLYTFTSHTFTNAGAGGRNGPTLGQIQSAYSAASWSQNTAFLNMNTQGHQLWTVPATGTYSFNVAGAKGGNSSNPSRTGGSGAVFTTNAISLSAGQQIKIIVGQVGGSSADGEGGNGGGGTVVYNVNTSALIAIAGGGGGSGNDEDGQSANASQENGSQDRGTS